MKKPYNALTGLKLAVIAVLLAALPLTTWAITWPQEISAPEGTIIVYQPQPEKLDGNILAGRAAMSLELTNQADPIFGAFWFSARIDTDTDADTAWVRDFTVTRVSWADSTDANEQRFTTVVEGAMPTAGFEISLERLSASLANAEQVQKSLDDLKNDPPDILFREELSVLLMYEGDPRFSPVENSDYERALNTPFLVLRNTRTKVCYLSSGVLWYQSRNPLGPWAITNSPPADLVALVPEPEADEQAPEVPPQIVSATEPTELISTQGKPTWDSLPGGDLLYVSNTETAWLRELESGNMYVLLSGRWYRSRSQEGPWTFVRADELPEAFQDIPPASDIGGLRVSVAGTAEAEEAMMDAQIPQTAAINRQEASLEVDYDGKPQFEAISGTQVSYAVNTGAQVMEINQRYYAVDNGVWFTSASATGPWVVADEIPNEQIQQIPPSAPVYNTTYVQIYQSTPEVVYVGYTPGYMWSFPYYGVPVYGTGWYYRPWWGGVYYPRPPTWGLHVGYNPWTGWNFGVSWGYGFMRVGVGWGGGWHGGYHPGRCCGGWYGGGYHRRPVVINTGNINIGNSINIGNRNTINNRMAKNSVNVNNRQSTNLYNRPDNRQRNASPTVARSNLKQATAAKQRPNNVYADQNGNVARHTKDGWQQRDQGSWKTQPSTRPANDRTPAQPVQRPASPTQRPANPAQRPATPTQRPATPTQRPATPTQRPATPTQRPATPTQRPSTMPSSQTRQGLDQNSLNRSRSARQTGTSREKASRPQGGRGQKRN